MEILLNLVWAALALSLAALWLRTADPAAPNRRLQIVALIVLIAVLFPVISVSDDVMAAQNPSETDSIQRRDYLLGAGSHPLSLPAAILAAASIDLPVLSRGHVATLNMQSATQDQPEFTSIGSRPPPTA